jgi:hypothetical protein
VTAFAARRLLLGAEAVAELCRRLGLAVPPGFASPPGPVGAPALVLDGQVHPSVAAGLRATCAPQVGVLLRSSLGDVAAALGVRDELGGSLLRAAGSRVEVSAWPALELGAELARCLPPLPAAPRQSLQWPLHDLATCPELADIAVGTLQATVVRPPQVLGRVTWLATAQGWFSLEAAGVRDGVRWVVVEPVEPADLGPALAPAIGTALS